MRCKACYTMYYIECTTRADSADPLMRYAFYQGMRSPLAHGQYIIDVLWGQPIKLIQVVSTSEFHEY